MKIEIFIKESCPESDQAIFLAQELSQRSDHTYEVYTLGKNLSQEQLDAHFSDPVALPQIKIDDVAIGNYQAFADMFVNRLY
jgi:hypothetical protein